MLKFFFFISVLIFMDSNQASANEKIRESLRKGFNLPLTSSSEVIMVGVDELQQECSLNVNDVGDVFFTLRFNSQAVSIKFSDSASPLVKLKKASLDKNNNLTYLSFDSKEKFCDGYSDGCETTISQVVLSKNSFGYSVSLTQLKDRFIDKDKTKLVCSISEEDVKIVRMFM